MNAITSHIEFQLFIQCNYSCREAQTSSIQTTLMQSHKSYPLISPIQLVRISLTEKVSPNSVKNKAAILFAYKLICAFCILILEVDIANFNKNH